MRGVRQRCAGDRGNETGLILLPLQPWRTFVGGSGDREGRSYVRAQVLRCLPLGSSSLAARRSSWEHVARSATLVSRIASMYRLLTNWAKRKMPSLQQSCGRF